MTEPTPYHQNPLPQNQSEDYPHSTEWGAPPPQQFTNGYGGYGVPQQSPPPRQKGRGGLIVAVAALAALFGGAGGSYLTQTHTFTGTTPTKIVQENVSQTVSGGVNWNGTAKTVSPSVVTIDVSDPSSGSGGEGSGVVFDDKGHIVTNYHVVNFGSGATITVIAGDTAYSASVVGTDPTSDLAVLKLNATPKIPLKPIKIADSSKVFVGENVMALGSPLGLQGTVTTGIVSALNRPVLTQQDSTTQSTQNSNSGVVVTNAIQTSAPINPGNSGGALVNANGELVGINSSIATLSSGGYSSSSQSGSIGIGFAIPSNQVKKVTEQILSKGKASHAYLGITPSDYTVATDNNSSVGTLGVRVKSVGSNSPASKAGLKTGDTIINLNGQAMTSSESLVATVRAASPGDKVTLTVVTETGKTEKVSVTLGNTPAS